jgi:hypothetical protein
VRCCCRRPSSAPQDKVLTPQQVAAREPLLAAPLQLLSRWAAAPFGRRQRSPPTPLLGASLARLLASGAVSAADAQAAVQQAADRGARYIVGLPLEQGAQVLVHRDASSADLMQGLVHAHLLAASGAPRAAGGAGKAGSGVGAQTLVVPAPGSKFVDRDYPQLLLRLAAAGWETDRVSLVAPSWTLRW